MTSARSTTNSKSTRHYRRPNVNDNAEENVNDDAGEVAMTGRSARFICDRTLNALSKIEVLLEHPFLATYFGPSSSSLRRIFALSNVIQVEHDVLRELLRRSDWKVYINGPSQCYTQIKERNDHDHDHGDHDEHNSDDDDDVDATITTVRIQTRASAIPDNNSLFKLVVSIPCR
jgi:hypothetical protein